MFLLQRPVASEWSLTPLRTIALPVEERLSARAQQRAHHTPRARTPQVVLGFSLSVIRLRASQTLLQADLRLVSRPSVPLPHHPQQRGLRIRLALTTQKDSLEDRRSKMTLTGRRLTSPRLGTARGADGGTL